MLHSSKKVDVLVRVPHLQQNENSTKFTNQIALNNKFDYRFSSPLLELFKIISSETPIPTLLEAVQKKKTKLPYKKGSYQKEVINCVSNLLTHLIICMCNLLIQLFRTNQFGYHLGVE